MCAVSKDWHLSTVYQVQTGFPFTISVFGDTADAGTELGENPIRANVRGSHCFPRELAPPKIGSIPRHLTRLPLISSGMRDAIQFIGRARKRWMALVRDFSLTERARFQFRGEFINALNHTNLGTPDGFVNTPQFGTITEATTPGREIQLSAKLSF